LFFSGYETANNRDIYFFSRFTFLRFLFHRLPGFVFPFGLLVPLAAAGAVSLRRSWRRLLPLYLFCGGLGSSFAVFFVNARFRMALVPFLLVLAIGGVAALVRKRRRSGWLAPVAAFVLCYVPLNLNLAGLRGTNEAQVYSMLAGYEVKEGNEDKAEGFLLRARTADPGWADQYFVAGLLARKRGDAIEAERMFQTALLHDSTNADYWVYLGDLKYSLGQLDSASSFYRRALEFDPYSAFALCHLGSVQFDQGDYGAALESYCAATELIPDYIVAIFNVGLVHYQVGDSVRAREWWQRVVETDPDHRLARQVEPWLRQGGAQLKARD
jgi:tetratricopeptide (TPR) repeat protein